MKTLYVILVLALVGANASVAVDKYTPEYLKMARQNYLAALDSENPGVRADAIFQILKFKARYPDENFKPLIEKLEKMSQQDECLQNRLHAYLACTFLETKGMAQQIEPRKFEEGPRFFAELMTLLNSERLALE